MAKFRSIKNSLIAGEISATAHGRTDLAQYPHACKTLRNMIPILSGGAGRRPGSFFESKIDLASETAPRLIPFIFSKTEAYCIAMNSTYDPSAGTYTGQAKWYRPTANDTLSTSGTVTLTGTLDFEVSQAGITLISESNYDEVHDFQYAQSADVMTIVHPKHKPLKLTRTALESFTLKPFDDGLTGTDLRDAYPYRPQNTTSITLQPSATSGTGITITSSSAFFDVGHVGALLKINHAGTIGCAKITDWTSATAVIADVVVTFGSTSAQTEWWESAWSKYRGWPSTICFFQQRLLYGGNLAEPDSIWFSESSDFNQLSHDTIVDPRSSPTGSQAFTIQMSSTQLNIIQWMSPEKTLVVGTTGDEFVIDRETTSAGFGCDNAEVLVQTHYGSSYHKAVRIGSELVFCLRSDDELRALVFNQLEDSYTADPIQSLYDEYPKVEPIGFSVNRKFRGFEWDESRKTLWCCDTAGNLFGLTRDRGIGLNAWHSHRMGGYDAAVVGTGLTLQNSPVQKTQDPIYRSCSGSVASVAVIPNPTIGTNDIWIAVHRKINGTFSIHIERIIGKPIAYDSVYNLIDFKNGGLLVDAAISKFNFSGTTFTGLSHLEGEVPIGVGSNTFGLFKVTGSAVSGGSTDLQKPLPTNYANEDTAVLLGLPFDCIVEPVRLEAGSQIGTSQGALKRITKTVVRLYKTMAAKIGRDANTLETIRFREGSTPMGNSAEIYTGDKVVDFPGDYDRDGGVYLVQDEPLPFSVCSIIVEGQTYD